MFLLTLARWASWTLFRVIAPTWIAIVVALFGALAYSDHLGLSFPFLGNTWHPSEETELGRAFAGTMVLSPLARNIMVATMFVAVAWLGYRSGEMLGARHWGFGVVALRGLSVTMALAAIIAAGLTFLMGDPSSGLLGFQTIIQSAADQLPVHYASITEPGRVFLVAILVFWTFDAAVEFGFFFGVNHPENAGQKPAKVAPPINLAARRQAAQAKEAGDKGKRDKRKRA